MIGLWLEERRLSFRNDLPDPNPAPGQALLRTRLAGICSTDLELVKGYYPYSGIPGHEFVADVIEVNASADLKDTWLGKRVVGEINLSCHECLACRAGNPSHCEKRTVLGIANHSGAFAQLLTLPLENLHLVPGELTDEAAVFTEPLAAALEIQEQIQIHPSDRVLIVGAGRLGLLIAQTLALTGCNLYVAARRPEPQRLLAGWGIQSIQPKDVTARQMDVVIEASGSPEGFLIARQAVRPRGTIVMKSTYAGDMSVNFSSIVVDEITLVGSRCGPFEPALRLLAAKRVDPLPLVTQRYPFDKAISAFEYAARPGVLKVLLGQE